MLFHVMIMHVYTTLCQVNRYTISCHHINTDFINIQGYNVYLFCTLKQFYQNINKSRKKDDSNVKDLKVAWYFWHGASEYQLCTHCCLRKYQKWMKTRPRLKAFDKYEAGCDRIKGSPMRICTNHMIIGKQFDQKKLHSTEVYLSPNSPMHMNHKLISRSLRKE